MAGSSTRTSGGLQTRASVDAPPRTSAASPEPRAPAAAHTASRAGRRWLASAMLAVSVLAGGVATTAVIRAGHSGSDAVWHDTRDGSGGSGSGSGSDDSGDGALRP
jgi:hypothetical protein